MDSWHLEPGEEEYTQFYSIDLGKVRVQYDYRDHDGQLFQTVCDDLETARKRRDEWQEEKRHMKILDSVIDGYRKK